MADENGNSVSSSSATATVTVKAKNNTGANEGNNSSPGKDNEPKPGTVSSCYINGIKVNEYLNVKNKDSVSIKVNTSTKEGLKIYNNKTKKTYTAKSGATTNVQVVEGEQTLTITLDTGYKTTRRIISIKEGETVEPNVIDEPSKENEQDTEKVLLKSLSVKGVKAENDEKLDFAISPEFSSEIYEYSITIPKEQSDIIKLEIDAVGEKKDSKIEITGHEELIEGDNTVTIVVKSKDGKNSSTYKITVHKQTEEVIAAVTTPEEEPTQNIEPEEIPISLIKNIIVAITLVITIAGIIFAVVEYKYTNKTKEGNEGEYFSYRFKKEEDINNDIIQDNYEEDDERFELDNREKIKRRSGKHF